MPSPAYQAAVVDAPRDAAALAWDIGYDSSKSYSGHSNNAAAVQHYLQLPASARHHYEVIRDSRPSCVGFDFDLKRPPSPDHANVLERLHLAPDCTPDDFLHAMMGRVCQEIPELRAAPLVVSSSHRTSKISFHVKVPTFYLADIDARKRFKKLIASSLKDLVPCLDAGVYSSNRLMRLVFSSKVGDPSGALVPVEPGAQVDAATVLQHMWSEVGSEAVPLDIPGTSTNPRLLAPGTKRPRTQTDLDDEDWLTSAGKALGAKLFSLAGLNDCSPARRGTGWYSQSGCQCPFPGCGKVHKNSYAIGLNRFGSMMLTYLTAEKHSPGSMVVQLDEEAMRKVQVSGAMQRRRFAPERK